MWIGIPCVLSLFHGLEMIFGKERYKKDVQEFNVSTEYNGNIAENLIKFLKNETIKVTAIFDMLLLITTQSS